MDIICLLAETAPSIILSEYKIKSNLGLVETIKCEICFNSENCNLIDILKAHFSGTTLQKMLEYFPLIKEYRIIECSFTLCLICLKQLVSSYLFLEKINKSNEILKELVLLPTFGNKIGERRQSVEETDNISIKSTDTKKGISMKCDSGDDTFVEENCGNDQDQKDGPKDRLHLRDVDNTQDHCYTQYNDTEHIEATNETENGDKLETIQILIEEIENAQKTEFICDVCKTVFTRKQSLDYHIRRVHLNEKKFLCPTCGKRFFLKVDYNRHILLHKGDTAHKCNLCKKGFVTSNLLRNHKRTVHKAKEIKCTQCPKMFKLQNQLNRHILAVHKLLRVEKGSVGRVNEKVDCNICGKQINKYTLNTHMERHSGSKKYQCNICGQEFFQQLSLNHHMVRHQDPKFSCEYCGKCHFTKQEMLTHIRRQHTREIVCSCQQCGKGFVHQTNLLQHMRNCHPRDKEEKFVEPKIPKQCTVCGKIYSSRTSLIHHRRRAHENKGYSCTECDITFKNLVPFKSHLKKIHNIGDTYECDQCSKSFYTRQDLCKHKKRIHHTGTNSWYLCCTVCQVEKFKTKHELIQHMQAEHLMDASTDTPILYECNICATFFVKFEIFQNHLDKEHPDKTGNDLDILEYEIGGCKVQYFQSKRHVEPQ